MQVNYVFNLGFDFGYALFRGCIRTVLQASKAFERLISCISETSRCFKDDPFGPLSELGSLILLISAVSASSLVNADNKFVQFYYYE